MPLNVSAGAGSFIDDFVHSKDPRFKGKSKEQRIKMALGAYYAKKRESNSKVIRVLNDIELVEWISGRSVVSSDPPSGLKQPSTSGQSISSGNATIINPTSNAPSNPTVNNLNKPSLNQQYSTSTGMGTNVGFSSDQSTPIPVATSTPQSSLTTSAGSLLGAGMQAQGQISSTPADTSMTGGSNGTYGMNKSPRELSNMLAKNGSGTQSTQQSSSGTAVSTS
jgi:hypothetical protein